MGKVTPEKAEIISQYVLDCNIWRLTAEETAQYLTSKGYQVDVRTVKRYRSRIKASASEWIATLAKSKRADYIAEYKERTNEIRACQRELWRIINNTNTESKIVIDATAKLLDCTAKLTDLYERVPMIAAIRESSNDTTSHTKNTTTKAEEIF